MKKKFLFIMAALFLAFGVPFSSLNIRVYNHGLPHQQGKARYVENQLLAKAGLRTLIRTPHLLQRFPSEIRQLHHDPRLNVEVIDTQPG